MGLSGGLASNGGSSGGGSVSITSPDSSVTVAGTGPAPTLAVAAGAKTGWINVLAYGADRSGAVACDTAYANARTAALAQAHGDGVPVIYFPDGNYNFAASIDASNVLLQGDGQGATKLTISTDLAAANVLATPAAPTGFVDASVGGSITGSTTVAYRVAAFGAYGATGWGAEATHAVPAGTNTNTVTVSGAVPKFARGVLIYGRTSGAEQLIARVYTNSAATYSYTDTGAITPLGNTLPQNVSACNGAFFLDQQPSSPMVTPGAPTLAGAAGGSLTSLTTYFYQAVSATQAGKTLASVEASAAPGGTNGSIVVTATPSEGALAVEFYGRTTGAELLIGSVNVGTAVLAGGVTLPLATISLLDGRELNPAGGKVVMGGQVVTYAGVTTGVAATADKMTGCSGGSGTIAGGTWVGQVVSFTDDGSVTPAGALPVANTTGGAGKPAAAPSLIGGAPKAATTIQDVWISGSGQHMGTVGSQAYTPGCQMTGVRQGNGVIIQRCRIAGWFAGVFQFSDHEEIYDGAVGGNYYALYLGNPSQSSGDQIVRRTRLDGSTWAGMGIAAGKSHGGKEFQDLHVGACPFGIYKESSISGGDQVCGGKLWNSMSFESCTNGNVYCAGDSAAYRGASILAGSIFLNCGSVNSLQGSAQAPLGTSDYRGRPIDRISYIFDLNGSAFSGVVDGVDAMDPGSTTGYVAIVNASWSGEHRVAANSLASAASNAKLVVAGGNGGGGVFRNAGLSARPLRCSPVSTVVKNDLLAYGGWPFSPGSPGQPACQRYDKSLNGGQSMRPAGVAAHGGMSVDGSTLVVYYAGGPISVRQTTAIAGGLPVAPDPANAGCVQPLAGVQILTSQGGNAAPSGFTAGAPTGVDGNWASATTYFYVITALGPWGETQISTERNAVIGATGAGGNHVPLSWTAYNPGGIAATGYKIYRSTVAGTYTTPALVTSPAAGATTYNDTGTAVGVGAPPATIGGTWTAAFRGAVTAGLSPTITAANLQTALVGLVTVGTGNVVCVGGPLGTLQIWVMWAGSLAQGYEQPLVVTNSAGLTGGFGTPTVDVAPGNPLIVGESLQASSGGLVQINLGSL